MDGQPGSNSISLDHIAFHLLLRQAPGRDEVERCPSCLFVDLEYGERLEDTKLVSYGSDLPDKTKTTAYVTGVTATLVQPSRNLVRVLRRIVPDRTHRQSTVW
jgi:hypothetical protein